MPSVANRKPDSKNTKREQSPVAISGRKRSPAHSVQPEPSAHESRIINVSQKRQITLPLKYYQALGLGDQVECSFEDGAIIIRPISKDGGEFSVEILKDLVAQGLSGDELIAKFTQQSQKIKTAIGQMLKDADDLAIGESKSASVEDIFGDAEDV